MSGGYSVCFIQTDPGIGLPRLVVADPMQSADSIKRDIDRAHPDLTSSEVRPLSGTFQTIEQALTLAKQAREILGGDVSECWWPKLKHVSVNCVFRPET